MEEREVEGGWGEERTESNLRGTRFGLDRRRSRFEPIGSKVIGRRAGEERRIFMQRDSRSLGRRGREGRQEGELTFE